MWGHLLREVLFLRQKPKIPDGISCKEHVENHRNGTAKNLDLAKSDFLGFPYCGKKRHFGQNIH